MTDRTIHVTDELGTIRDWLVTQAWSVPADDLDQVLAASGSPWTDGPDGLGRWVLTNGPDVAAAKEALHARRPLGDFPPEGEVEEGGPWTYRWGDLTGDGRWARQHTAEDGLVDWSEFCFTPTYRLALAACLLEVDQADRRTLRIACTGPFRAFLDGRLVASSDLVTYMEPRETVVEVALPSRTSTLVIATWQVAFRECRQVLRVRVDGLPVQVVIPSPGADEAASALAERLLDAVGAVRWASHDGTVALTGPEGLRVRVRVGPMESEVVLGPEPVEVTLVPSEEHGPVEILATHDVAVVGLPDPRVPLTRSFPVARLPLRFRGRPEGTPEQWRAELLEHAAGLRGVAAALARVTREPQWTIDPALLEQALWMVRNRCDCADFEVVGLCHLLHRAGSERWAPGLREEVLDALAGLKYWIEEPGLDAMCYFTENHQLVWHTAEILAGQFLPDRTFTNDGRRGREHADHGVRLATQWVRARLAGGFSEFDSNAYLAIDTLALVSLVEFCEDEELRRLAEGLADRVLLSLACNSWHGIHGSAHGRSYIQTLRSARLEETSPLSWGLFGVGCLNEAVLLPAVVAASAQRYRVPEVARSIVAAEPDEFWAVQRYRGEYRFEHDLLARPFGSDTVIFRTPHVLLASAQDYRPGLPGLQEHIWGATLGPEAQVFVTHAPNASFSPSARPNAWAGNRELPRVRQHRDVLLGLYRLRPDDPTGLTHAWFPTTQLDEWVVSGVWTVGRLGDGYVALACAGGAELVTTGRDALQELRPRGNGRAWVCVVGDAPRDGDLAAFVASLPAPTFGPDAVGVRRRGRDHELTWDGPFLVDGVCPDLVDGLPPVDPPAHESPWVRCEGDLLVYECEGETHVLDRTRGRVGRD